MVMSKVSKAIAASFLCLLFNAGGNVTNAMNNFTNAMCPSPNGSFSKEEIPNINNINNNRNNATPMGGQKVNDTEKVEIKEKIEEKDEKKEGEDGKKIPWNIILPIITGVGGLVGGILVGKFVF